MSILQHFVRRFRPGYIIYNFFKRNALLAQQKRYRLYGLSKPWFAPVSSRDFKNIPAPGPWLDEADSATLLPENPFFQNLEPDLQKDLLHWSSQGYAILPAFFSIQEVDTIKEETNKLVEKGQANWRKIGKERVMFTIRQSDKIRNIVLCEKLNNILAMLLGKKVRVFQSINFFSGSEQAAHSDSLHMTTFPLGYMIAVWIALEDITDINGPLSYYPGSHRLPYILNDDFDHGNSQILFGAQYYARYEEKIASVIAENKLQKQLFYAKKGDILIWHANLIHGGEPILHDGATRESMVLHYFAEEVVCYHEITQRPAVF